MGSKNPYTGTESRTSSHCAIVGEKITKGPTWFDNVVTTNESSVYVYFPLTKQQSSLGVMLLNRSTAPEDSTTDIKKNIPKRCAGARDQIEAYKNCLLCGR